MNVEHRGAPFVQPPFPGFGRPGANSPGRHHLAEFEGTVGFTGLHRTL